MIDALLDYYELALWILLCPVPIAVGIWSLFDKENRRRTAQTASPSRAASPASSGGSPTRRTSRR
jgi:hypothetical protein